MQRPDEEISWGCLRGIYVEMPSKAFENQA